MAQGSFGSCSGRDCYPTPTNDRRSVIDRIRKSFAKDRERYLKSGKVTEIFHLLMAAKRATRSTDDNSEGGDDSEAVANKEPLVTLVLPDDNTLEAMFQELRSTLRAFCTLTDKDRSWFFRTWEKFGRNKSQLGAGSVQINPKRYPSQRLILDQWCSFWGNRNALECPMTPRY